jgi:protein kinase-like protein
VSDLAPGTTFAGCRIEAVAGRGGMGVVYRATELALHRTVALKLVAPERAADASFHARFEQEARMAAAIDHPNVIPVFAAGEEAGRLFLVMRWVEGTDLQALIRESGRLDAPRAAAIVAQVGAGLEAAHRAGLVHRDVKPANVLIAGDAETGHVYLSDFGLTVEVSTDVRLTTSSEWIGTADFMAPEQFERGRVDARSDVYALGCLLHASLTGRAPFRRETVVATMLAHLNDPPPLLSETAGVPAAFDSVVARALAKDPDDRYQSAGELVSAALAAIDGEAAGAAPRPNETVHAGPAAATGSAATAVLTKKTVALRDRPARDPTVQTRRQAPPVTGSRRRVPSAVLVVAAIAIAGAVFAALAGAGPFGGEERTGPLSRTEVRGAVEGFAEAYAKEDDNALAHVLTRNVGRVTPSDSQRGRGPVLKEYRRQFAANKTTNYELQELQVRPGAIGRAEGRYVVSRSGGGPIAGRIVFGLRRDHGRPRIALIAATPES